MKFKKSIWILCFRIKIHISNAVNILRDCLQMFFSFINIIHGVFSASTVLLPHCCSLIKDWRKSDLKWILPNCSLYLHWKRKMTYELRLQWNFERRGWKNNKPKSVLQLFELLCFDSRRQRVREIERESEEGDRKTQYTFHSSSCYRMKPTFDQRHDNQRICARKQYSYY